MSENKEFIVAVDADDTMFRYIEMLWEVAKILHPEVADQPFVRPKHWTFKDCHPWPFTDRDDFMEAHRFLVDEGYMGLLEAYDDVSEVLWGLSNDGFRIHIVTHRLMLKGAHQKIVSSTVKNLDDHNIPYRDLSFVADKTAIRYNVLVDDAAHNIEAANAQGKTTIIFDQAANKHLAGTRAMNWRDVDFYVRQLRIHSYGY